MTRKDLAMWKIVLSALMTIGLLGSGPADRDRFLEHLSYLVSATIWGRSLDSPSSQRDQ